MVIGRHLLHVALAIEVTVGAVTGPDRDAEAAAEELLHAVLADPAARSFFLRQAAAIPFVDWPGGTTPQGLEWLSEEPQHLARVFARLSPETRAALPSEDEHQSEDELDAFYAAFRARFMSIEVTIME
ncbi:MAG: hypothetical protein ACK47B_17025 [Armatimonadota bacterium]